MKWISIACFAFIVLFNTSAIYAGEKAEINFDYLDDLVAKGHIPNYQVALVSEDGSISHQAGEYNEGIVAVSAVDPQSIVSLFSLSKPFTNLLALKLIDLGLLKLTDPISLYLPEFESIITKEKNKASKKTTRQIMVSDLLLHTAGFSQNSELQGWGETAENYREEQLFGLSCLAGARTESLASTVQRLAKIPLNNDPGEKYYYSVATDVLGRVLEVASGESFQSLLEKYVAKPLSLNTLAIKVAEPNIGKVAELYEPMIKTYPVPGAYQRYQPFSKFEVAVSNVGLQPGCVSPGSGLTASMEDMTKLASFFLRGMTLENGSFFLSEKNSRLAFENQLSQELGKSPMRGSFAYAKNDGLSVASLAIRTNKNGDLNNQKDHDFYYWSGFSGSGLWVDKKTNTAGIFITQLYPSDRFLIPKLVAKTREHLRLKI
jgi:CubicO group peptidase (beta-lactamase class C family)